MISREITAQNYELIRNQIGAIIALELDRQAAYYYVTEAEDVTVYIERFAPMDKNDLSCVNVSFDAVGYGNEHTGSSDGKYNFFVDVFVNSKATAQSNGDTLAGYKMQRLMGICRAILKDPQYKALGLNVPGAAYIQRSTITNMEALTIKDHHDALSTRVGRITMEVRANENIPFPDGNIMDEFITRIKLGESDKGMKYILYGQYDWAADDFNDDYNTAPD